MLRIFLSLNLFRMKIVLMSYQVYMMELSMILLQVSPNSGTMLVNDVGLETTYTLCMTV